MSNPLSPIVRLQLDVESMRHSVMHVMADHHSDIRKQVEAEISKLMTGGYLEERINQAVRRHLEAAIDAEVRQIVTAYLRNTPSISKTITEAVLESFARGSVGDE